MTTSAHVTFPTDKWQSVNKHINRLRKWRENRLRRDLDVSDLSNAIALAEAYMTSVLGKERKGNDAHTPMPHMSLGWMEQVMTALEASGAWDERPEVARQLEFARVNMHALIGEARKVNEFAMSFRRETELKLIYASQ